MVRNGLRGRTQRYRCKDCGRRFDTGTAAGIYDLRRLKIKLCAEPVEEARSVLDFCLSITPNVQVTGFYHQKCPPLISTRFITKNVHPAQ